MKFPSLPFLKKKNPFSYFLVLVLRREKANAVIFEELKGKIRVVGQHTEYFQKPIEEASVDEMLEALDKVISRAEESLPKNIETQKTIFGLIESWVEKDKIKKEYLAKLKKVCDELGLTPIGFLIITQAISHLLQKEEGAPVSAVLIELGSKSITVTLIRAGRIIETKSSEIHESVPYTVDTVLKHFQASEILPSRIILFDGELDLSQEFISHSWSKSLPFLHLPQIATLPPNFDAKAVLVGAATQMGFELLEPVEKKEINKEELIQRVKETEKEQEEMQREEEYLTLEDFGFVRQGNAAKKPIPEKPEKKEEPFGGVYPEQSRRAQGKQETVSPSQGSKIKLASLLVILKDNLSKIRYLKKIPIAILTGKKNIFIFAAVFLIALFIIFYLFGTSQTIVLTLKPKIIEQNKNVSFSTSVASNPAQGVLGAETTSVSEDGSNSTKPTGKKEIGEKAKGKVTIFNNNVREITLSSGTKITSSNGLNFTLDDTIRIASASSDPFEGIKPSKKDANVSASSIGQTSNLPSGTKFFIGDDPLLAAKNDNPFSGGTKKEVTVVSKNDVDKLLEELPKSLTNNAKDDIKKHISKDKSLIPIFTNITIAQKKLDREIGELAEKVVLNAKVVYESIVYKNDDLKSQAIAFIQNSVPKNLTLNDKDIKIVIKDVVKKKEIITANLNIKAILQPIIDKKSLASQLSGISFAKAKAKLAKIPQVSHVEISSSLNIPILPKMLTRNSKNIKIVVNVNE